MVAGTTPQTLDVATWLRDCRCSSLSASSRRLHGAQHSSSFDPYPRIAHDGIDPRLDTFVTVWGIIPPGGEVHREAR